MLKLGIIGQPRSGKTTICNAVAVTHAEVGGFTAPNEIRRTVLKVPDDRLERLNKLFAPPKKIHTEIEYVDFPPMTGDTADIASLPPALRDLDALLLVLREFGADADPKAEARAVCDELLLADLAVIEKRLSRLSKEIASGHTDHQVEHDALVRCRETLENEQPIRTLDFSPHERRLLQGYGFLSGMPLLAVINAPDDGSAHSAAEWSDLLALGPRTAVHAVRGKLESELNDLSPDDRQAFMADLGLTTSALDGMIAASYRLLGLITFFTGDSSKDVHAWTVAQGAKAPQAAGVIHSDFERGFIRAEVIPVEELLALGSLAATRKAGKSRLEGKDYVVNDGDYILFRFNV